MIIKKVSIDELREKREIQFKRIVYVVAAIISVVAVTFGVVVWHFISKIW